MPQMAPLLWLNLMISFSILLLMFNSLNYFSNLYKNKKILQSKKKINWKW
uniref:ATP synthase complex subunit 8 n=1 Tax=Rhagophthalmus giganteus TaxID=2591746 RepID=A0A5C0PZ58_9COLE|nr:ATP synthase F0 subunit 8 [Rhagophthalmus giganteus]